ncbi:hypothetical protein B566_EDAN006317 [Ephemera danica]|nr:hypothetical protein B566_EDAN006317 [Ephemera danica]
MLKVGLGLILVNLVALGEFNVPILKVDVKMFSSLYYKVFNKEYRERGPDSRLECLEEVLADYDKIIGEECSRLRVLDSQEFACAIITPLMKRNHVLNFHAGDICYVDSTGKCDRDKTAIKIFLLLTDSEAGLAGPQAFITEDCEALRNTISVVFPEATLLLSIPHIIQEYLRTIYSKRNLWAPYLFRQGLMMRGHAAIIVSETAMRVMRDVILHRLRNYNLPQLAHFVFTRVDEYYGRRLQDVVNDKEALAARRRFLSQFHFQVGEGNKTMFDVDVGVGTCSCSVGTTSGAPCKHQYAIAVHFGTHTLLPPTSYSNPGCPTSAKICLYQIATGRRVDLPDEWFKHQQPDEMPLNHPHHSSELQKVDVIDGPSLPPPSPVQSEPVHHVLEEASDEENREQTQETLHKFTSVFSKLKDKYLKDPSLYGPALERFCSTLESMPSDSSIVPALTNFGKYGAQNENTLEIPMSGWFN